VDTQLAKYKEEQPGCITIGRGKQSELEPVKLCLDLLNLSVKNCSFRLEHAE
jgi:hypothetical protein